MLSHLKTLTLGRSDLESMEMAERVRTAVTPNVTLSEVASLVSNVNTHNEDLSDIRVYTNSKFVGRAESKNDSCFCQSGSY